MNELKRIMHIQGGEPDGYEHTTYQFAAKQCMDAMQRQIEHTTESIVRFGEVAQHVPTAMGEVLKTGGEGWGEFSIKCDVAAEAMREFLKVVNAKNKPHLQKKRGRFGLRTR